MGGSGSTRWGGQWTRVTVESCEKIDIRHLYRKTIGKSAFETHQEVAGVLGWTSGSRVEYALRWPGDKPVLILSYSWSQQGGECQSRVQRIVIQTTVCHYGGVRYWLQCPWCRRRVGCLYQYGGSFACRKCHDLTYTSSQEAHRFDGLARRFGVGFDVLEESFKVEPLLERWYGKQRLTKSQRRKIAAYLGMPLAQVRNKWYQPATRQRRLAEADKLVERVLREARPEKV